MRDLRKRKRRRLNVESLENRNLLAADPFGTNALQPLDVNRDGFVTALDALRVINAVGRSTDPQGIANPADNVGSFIDVSGDGDGTALDALQVINALGRSQPIIAATLPNDSMQGGETNLDLLTNDYSIDLNISVAELNGAFVGIRVNAASDDPFVDITNRFGEGRAASLSASDVDSILGGIVPEGDNEFQFKIGEIGSSISFTLTIDRSSPSIQTVAAESSSVRVPYVYVRYEATDDNLVLDEPSSSSFREQAFLLESGVNTLTIEETDLAGNVGTLSLTRTYDSFFSLPVDLEQFRRQIVNQSIGLFTIGAGVDSATGAPIDVIDANGNTLFADDTLTIKHNISQPSSKGFTLVNQASILSGLSQSTEADKTAAANGSIALLNTIEERLDAEHGEGQNGLLRWLDLENGGNARQEFAFVDNGNLVLSLAAMIGIYDTSGYSDTSVGTKLRSKADAIRTRLTEGLLGLYDESEGRFLQIAGGRSTVDRLGSEWRSIVAFLVATESSANRAAWDNLTAATSTYVTQEDRAILAMNTVDGGLFQVTWPTLFLAEQDYALRDLQFNHLFAQLDFGDRNNNPGVLSAVGTGVEPYDYEGATGVLALAENPNLQNATVSSLYALLSGTALAPEMILNYTQQLLDSHPSLLGAHGPFDSASITGNDIDVREMYLAIDNGSSVIGMTGAGQIGLTAYLSAEEEDTIRVLYEDKEGGLNVVSAPKAWPEPDFPGMETSVDLATFDAGNIALANVEAIFQTDRLVYHGNGASLGFAIGSITPVDSSQFPTLLLRIRNASAMDFPQVNFELRGKDGQIQREQFTLDGIRDELLIGIRVKVGNVVAFGLAGIEPGRSFEILKVSFVNSNLTRPVS